MEPSEIARHIDVAGGVARGRSIPASRQQLAHAVDRDAVERLRNGVFATSRAAPDVRLAAQHGGEVACVSALRRRGVWVLADDALHVWLGPDGRAHPHHGCVCVPHRDDGRASFGVVSLVQALLQTATCVGAECFFAAFESAWRLGMLTRADRVEIRSRLPARLRWLVDIARPDADSGLESILRLRLHRIGIVLQSQVLIHGVGIVDFLLAGTIILEVDGRLNHDGASLRHKDLVRDAEAAARGFETLRFDYALVIHDWPRVERAIVSRLARTDARHSFIRLSHSAR